MSKLAFLPKCWLCGMRLQPTERYHGKNLCLDCAPRLGLPDVRETPTIEDYLVRTERWPIPE